MVVMETEEFQVVLQAFLEGLLTLLGKVLDLAFSHLEVVGLNQNQEILVEDPIPSGLLDEGNQASKEDYPFHTETFPFWSPSRGWYQQPQFYPWSSFGDLNSFNFHSEIWQTKLK